MNCIHIPNVKTCPFCGLRHCPQCDGWLAEADFGRNAANHDGLASYCRDCGNAQSRAYEMRLRAGRVGLAQPTPQAPQTIEIAARLAAGARQSDLAREYGLSRQRISQIARNNERGS